MNLSIPNINNTEQLKLFPKSIQKKINWFAFFLAFPFLSIGGNSITFFIFLAIVIRIGLFWKKSFRGKYLLLGLLFIGVISTIFTPLFYRHENFATIITLVQYGYWILMACFFIVYYIRIDFIQLSKWILYGAIGYTIVFYFIPINFKNPLISIEFKPGRNAYVFNMLSCIPLSFFYIQHKWKGFKVYLFVLFFLVVMLATNGRSGSIIIIIQLLLILFIINPRLQKVFKILVLFFAFIFVLSQNTNIEKELDIAANSVEKINPRLASLLRSEGEGDLTKDKSWLIRKLMIEKGYEIVEKHPLLGVGPNNFKYYNAELVSYKDYDRLQGISKKKFSSKISPHNTYLQVITEFGILGTLFYILLILRPILYFMKMFVKSKLTPKHFTLISLVGMSIHFYTIANLSGALPWFIIGLSWALINDLKNKNYKAS